MIVHVCDRCHEKIPECRTVVFVSHGVTPGFVPVSRHGGRDLCGECAMQLALFLRPEIAPRINAHEPSTRALAHH